ncbi:MAG: hypothetical protein FJ098_00895 [Deltaproteobacteria bacterium]|nr:hypothetical protein [Deltaproteobacteria bacterium]
MLESRYNRIALLLGSLLLLAAVLGTQALRQDIRLDRRKADAPGVAETSYMPPNPVLHVAALGHEAFLADLIFMQAQQYFYNHLITDRRFSWLTVYTDAIVGWCRGPGGARVGVPPSECAGEGRAWVTGLFPFNPRFYSWSTEVVKFVPRLTPDIVDRAIEFGRVGTEFCPDSWEIWFELGFNLFFEQKGLSEEERVRRSEQGIESITHASRLPGARVNPNFVVGHLWNRRKEDRAVEMAYRTFYAGTEAEREQMIRRLEVQGQGPLATAYREELGRWREGFPFISPTLFHHIDPGPGADAGPAAGREDAGDG